MNEIEIDINKFKKSKTSNTKILARIAFKRHKAGFETSDYEKYLIRKFYPFMRSGEEIV